jgi:hypothetical protein
MAVAVLAASSGPVQIWVNPSPTGTRSVDPSGPRGSSPGRASAEGGLEAWSWLGTVFNVIGVVLLATMAVAFVKLAIIPRNPWVRSWVDRLRPSGSDRFEALPDVADGDLDLDVEAARTALSGGTPRNAIVACWMQLEGDAARAGLPRLVAETSAEYTERVVASSSVDVAPIAELAALYREARFSGHSLGDQHRSRALSALQHVERSLGDQLEVPA